jgi:hypothetical protein
MGLGVTGAALARTFIEFLNIFVVFYRMGFFEYSLLVLYNPGT